MLSSLTVRQRFNVGPSETNALIAALESTTIENVNLAVSTFLSA